MLRSAWACLFVRWAPIILCSIQLASKLLSQVLLTFSGFMLIDQTLLCTSQLWFWWLQAKRWNTDDQPTSTPKMSIINPAHPRFLTQLQWTTRLSPPAPHRATPQPRGSVMPTLYSDIVCTRTFSKIARSFVVLSCAYPSKLLDRQGQLAPNIAPCWSTYSLCLFALIKVKIGLKVWLPRLELVQSVGLFVLILWLRSYHLIQVRSGYHLLKYQKRKSQTGL